jgi:hypothetical protein
MKNRKSLKKHIVKLLRKPKQIGAKSWRNMLKWLTL